MPPAAKAAPKPSLRKDPRPRHQDSAIWGQLVNRDPDRHYVYVNQGDPEAMAHYEFAGYEVERYSDHGVKPAGGRTVRDGAPIEMRGMVLMSVTRERYDEIVREGVGGDTGQALADRLEAQIIDRELKLEAARGDRSLSIVNDTESPRSEVVKHG